MTEQVEIQKIPENLGLIAAVNETVDDLFSVEMFSRASGLYKDGARKLIVDFAGVKDKKGAYSCASFFESIFRTDRFPIRYVGLDNQQQGLRIDRRVENNSYVTLDNAVESFK